MTETTRLKRIRPLHTWGRGVTAALPPFKRNGKGSTPFDPTGRGLRLEATDLRTMNEIIRVLKPRVSRLRPIVIGIKVLAAACLALNQVGEGSSPSDPTE